jgi:hypothetical protein
LRKAEEDLENLNKIVEEEANEAHGLRENNTELEAKLENKTHEVKEYQNLQKKFARIVDSY